MKQFVLAGVHLFEENAITAEALELQPHQLQVAALARYHWDRDAEQAAKESEEERKQEEQRHHCWRWSTEPHEKGLLLRLDGAKSKQKLS